MTVEGMTYQKASAYMDSLAALGSVPGLDSIRRLCQKLDNPQDALSFVHIAGTNGKGSVSAFLSYVLMEAGIKVGRYNSPAVFEPRERFCVGERMISRRLYALLLSRVKEACDEIVSEGYPHPTAFEAETALGFLFFAEKGCELCVLEAGMGGELDATNLITTTKLAVLTSISMDHMQFLGGSLAEIATQKSGIIKPGCAVVSAKQALEAEAVIKEVCQKKKASLVIAQPDRMSRIHFGSRGQSFVLDKKSKIEISLLGSYQLENAYLAVLAARELARLGYPIREEHIKNGMKKAVWHGRFERIAQKPLIVIDGAHNEDAARKLAESVRFYFTNKRIIYIIGVLRDKEYEKLLALSAPLADSIITVRPPDNPRALDAYELAKAASRFHERVTAADSIEEALEMARLLAGKDGVIVAFGSLSYLGKLKKAVTGE